MFPQLSNLSAQPITYLLTPFLVAFLLTALLLPLYIIWLKRLQIGQFIREEGPASHAAKAKTPTTGGIFFVMAVLSAFILISIFYQHISMAALATTVVAVLCALLGLADDVAKIMNRANKGLSASRRLLLEAIIGAACALFLVYAQPQAMNIILSLSSHITALGTTTAATFTLPVLVFIGLAIFLVAATANSVNLHDGMDGLAAGTALPIFLTLAIMLIKTNNFTLALLAMSCAGAVSAFLLFNCNPAKIFMGDTGSLFLGGFLAALVLSSGLVLWFIPLASIYILETISVLMQVSYFKLTKPYQPPTPMNKFSLALYKLTHKLPGEGKRIFRMAPLHHHFESILAEKGILEWQVVLGFWLIQLLICAVVLAAFFRI